MFMVHFVLFVHLQLKGRLAASLLVLHVTVTKLWVHPDSDNPIMNR